MSDQMPGLPGPTLTPFTEPYWTAAREARLVIQRCAVCGTYRHPPGPVCHHCQSPAATWADVPGTGTVYTYMWAERAVAEVFSHLIPYNVTVVELDLPDAPDGSQPVRLISRVNDVTTADLVVGLPVVVAFDRVDDSVALPVFRVR